MSTTPLDAPVGEDTYATPVPDTGVWHVARKAISLAVWAVAVVGIGVLFYRLSEGLGVTNLGSIVPWGMWVAFYIFFIGLSAGAFLLSTLVFVFGVKSLEPLSRLAVVQAIVCLALGLVFIFIDLGHWERFLNVLIHPQRQSVLTWEIWIYNIYAVVLLLELYLLMRSDLSRWGHTIPGGWGKLYRVLALGFSYPVTAVEREAHERATAKWTKIVGIIGIPVALGVHGGTGTIFAVVKARPEWYTPLFPLLFIISAMASGGGLLLFARVFFLPDPLRDRKVLPQVANLVAGFLIFDILLLFLEVLISRYGGIPDHIAPFQLMMYGKYSWVFWGPQILLGAAIPLLVLYSRPGGQSKYKIEEIGIAGLLILVGIFAVRINIVIPALAVPVLQGVDSVWVLRLKALYEPNWIEWLSSLGLVALGVQVFRIVLHRLPLREHQEWPRRGPSRASMIEPTATSPATVSPSTASSTSS
jgi:molybdopterin-containing oxidoreductase family membrane subunit